MATSKRTSTKGVDGSASQRISERIAALDDWRAETFAKLRALIHQADPDIVEELKWMETPVFSHDGIVCTGEVYKKVVKLTFAKGAFVKDPSGLFNSSLEGNLRRAIDFHEGDKINERAFKALVSAAVALNAAGKKAARPKNGASVRKASSTKATPARKKASFTQAAPARKKASFTQAAPARKKASSTKAARSKRKPR